MVTSKIPQSYSVFYRFWLILRIGPPMRWDPGFSEVSRGCFPGCPSGVKSCVGIVRMDLGCWAPWDRLSEDRSPHLMRGASAPGRNKGWLREGLPPYRSDHVKLYIFREVTTLYTQI